MILGGGQLAMYLCAAARQLGFTSTVLAHNTDAPAAHTADKVVYGELNDLEKVASLAASADVVTFDIEEIPPETLEFLASEALSSAVSVQPVPATILLLQDKLLQKQWLARNGLPTLPFRSFEEDANSDEAFQHFGFPCVQKARRGGYDGRGVQIIDSPELGDRLWPVASIIEPCLQGVRELSVVGARSATGEIECYEVAELFFRSKDNVLDAVLAPAQLSDRQRDTAIAIARRALDKLQGAGVYAIELFLTEDDALLINEISPRVHNSGHHSLESTETSQFEQHLRAITGMALGPASQTRPAAMINLLYEAAFKGRFPDDSVIGGNLGENTHLHWYGKRKEQLGRKVGHITTVADTADQALQLAREAQRNLLNVNHA